MSDDELLASVLRKFLSGGAYIDWGYQRSNTYPYWVTIDGTAAITQEEQEALAQGPRQGHGLARSLAVIGPCVV